MAYTAWSVVYGEQPTAAKWNQLGANDAGFKDGTNIDAGAIITTKIADNAVTNDKMGMTQSVDANGWKVSDYGTFKKATKRLTWTGSMSIASLANLNLAGMNLPVGVTDRSNLRWTYSYSTNLRVFLVNETGSPSSNGFSFVVNNWYNIAFTLTSCYVDVELTY